MSVTTAMTSLHLTRAELWSSQLKEVLQDELTGQGYVRWMTDFPDGDVLTIPSIGEGTVRDYTENTPIVYDSMDSGEYQFRISEYKSSATYITKKARQDAFYAAQLESSFVPKQARALAENLETDIFSLALPGAQQGNKWGHSQTNNDGNSINGANHRFTGTGTGRNIAIADFARALYALKRANVPDSNLIAIVDPSVELTFNLNTSITSLANATPQWDAINQTGIASGMRFIRNLYGFDIYVSNYLARSTAVESGLNVTTVVGDVNNIFFSAASPDIMPFVGAWRQMPEVESDYNKDFQREEYLTTARYGLDLYRPENLVTIVTGTTVS